MSPRSLKVFTDFSGKASGNWTAYGFLFTSEEDAENLSMQLSELRYRMRLTDGRRFEYNARCVIGGVGARSSSGWRHSTNSRD